MSTHIDDLVTQNLLVAAHDVQRRQASQTGLPHGTDERIDELARVENVNQQSEAANASRTLKRAHLSVRRVKLNLIRQLHLLAVDLDTNHFRDFCLVLTRVRLVALDPSSSGGRLGNCIVALRHLLNGVRESLSLVVR